MRNYVRERPFELPDSLDDLKGPADGLHTLPRNIYWGPDRKFSLETHRSQHFYVTEIILNATKKQLSELLS
ncbi:MAG: hypothetical protein QM571_00045, partial [Micrococcaceae bacterium]